MKVSRKEIACILATLITFSAASVFGQEDIKQYRSCAYCGMDRKAYGFSRILITYGNGSYAGTCSLHCAVHELTLQQDRTVKSIHVADRESRILIDASQAIWVMGGRKRGVMTQVPKWAFGSEKAAAGFIRDNGGKIVSWEEARVAAQEELTTEKN